MHPNTNVTIFWLDNEGRQEEILTNVGHFKERILNALEIARIDNVEKVFYTVNNETYVLDYYNPPLEI